MAKIIAEFKKSKYRTLGSPHTCRIVFIEYSKLNQFAKNKSKNDRHELSYILNKFGECH